MLPQGCGNSFKGKLYCDIVASDLKMSSAGSLSLDGRGFWKKPLLLDDARLVVKQFSRTELYEITNDQLIRLRLRSRPLKRIHQFVQLSKEKREFCFMTEDNKLFMFFITPRLGFICE